MVVILLRYRRGGKKRENGRLPERRCAGNRISTARMARMDGHSFSGLEHRDIRLGGKRGVYPFPTNLRRILEIQHVGRKMQIRMCTNGRLYPIHYPIAGRPATFERARNGCYCGGRKGETWKLMGLGETAVWLGKSIIAFSLFPLFWGNITYIQDLSGNFFFHHFKKSKFSYCHIS